MKNKIVNDFVRIGHIPPFPEEGRPYYFDDDCISYAYYRLIPGYIYTFVSSNVVQEDDVPSLDEYQTSETKSVKPYFDRRPIILSLGQEGPMEVGLNLKLMPLNVRHWFLSKYYKIVSNLIDKSQDENGEFIELKERMKLSENLMLKNINRNFINQVGEQNNINFKFLVDKYTRGEMSNKLAIIDWEQAIKLPKLSYVNDGSVVTKTPISYFLKKFT
jgi:hypothetical protein